MAIPKVIHYCWFGGNPLPSSAKKCINSWKKFCPDYKIIEWDETNFDVQCNKYCTEMYERKKWAFLSDYARLKIVYEQGGIYLDTDVEVVKPLDDLLKHNAFMGIDTTNLVATGLGFGAVAGHPFLKKNIECYEAISNYDAPPLNSHITTDILKRNKQFDKYSNKVQYIEDVNIYPPEFFCAKHTHSGIITITKNTYSIHHFTLSWATEEVKAETKKRWKKYKIERIKKAPKLLLRKLIGDERVDTIKRLLHRA